MYQLKDMRTRNQAYLTRGISWRAELLDQEKVLNEAMIDPYEFVRDAYLLRRLSQVYEGNPPRQRYDDEESSDTAQPQPSPATNTPSTTTDNPSPTAPQ
jgi:phospholipid-binding lipoprotein MlaA